MNKEQLITELENVFSKTVNWLNEQPEARFNQEIIPDKWTTAHHIYHLIKSTRAVSKGMKMPKVGLRTMFGKNNRQERTYNETYEKYIGVLGTGVKASSDFSAEPGRSFEKVALIERFEGELDDMKTALKKWNEKSLSEYVMPHPALGKMTVRELIYFTIFHTQHHLQTLEEKYGVGQKDILVD